MRHEGATDGIENDFFRLRDRNAQMTGQILSVLGTGIPGPCVGCLNEVLYRTCRMPTGPFLEFLPDDLFSLAQTGSAFFQDTVLSLADLIDVPYSRVISRLDVARSTGVHQKWFLPELTQK